MSRPNANSPEAPPAGRTRRAGKGRFAALATCVVGIGLLPGSIGLSAPSIAFAQDASPPATTVQDASPLPLPPAAELEYLGVAATGIALRRLGQTGRVLHIGAHPDDENTALFSPLALGRGADVAYLSLTRGEGGQNGIGPELDAALGLVRTEELLAARRLDGATQFFTRAIDFGYSKTAAETFTHWPKDSVLADVVAVIRYYRPDVVVSVWSGTRRDGHGQHEASGILAREAVLAAGDPARFPGQLAAGLRPHTVSGYYWSARYGADGPDVELNTGELDPLLGRSYHQIAMASRSRHRSQDMGVPEAPGPRRTEFDRVDPADPPEVVLTSGSRTDRQLEGRARLAGSLFAGVDTLLSQRAATAGADEAIEPLREYEEILAGVREEYDPFHPESVFPRLMGARVKLDEARAVVAAGARSVVDADLGFHLAGEARDLRDAVLRAANLRFDVRSDQELVVPGQEFELELSAWNGGGAAVYVTMAPDLPADWSAEPVDGAAAEVLVTPGELVAIRWTVRVPGHAELTAPYFLAAGETDAAGEPSAGLYDWPQDVTIRGLPFAARPVRAAFTVDFRPLAAVREAAAPVDPPSPPDATFRLKREAAWFGLDARSGEYRRPVAIVPRLSAIVQPRLVVVPIAALNDSAGGALAFRVVVRGEAPGGTTARVRPAAPQGWSVSPESVDLDLEREGEERTVRFEVSPPADAVPGVYPVGALVDGPGCRGATPCAALEMYAHGYRRIDYPHIRPHHLYRPATARVRLLDVEAADVRVGYVAGVPDGVPEALGQLGLEWRALDAAALAEDDLSRFDVIVAGTRAYELRPDLVANNHRLLDWARRGGTLISLYNKYPALEGSYAPWPVTIASPHGRVTDENAEVTILEPDHPIFNTPNRIGPADWEGWVQERGLYLWETWEGPLRPLLAMSDPGEAPLEGSLLVAPLGDGTYVYTALALFRQLPEGVPGAYRLLANLLSLGAR